MKAICWQGASKVRLEHVPDPRIEEPHDIIVKVQLTSISGKDQQLFRGLVPELLKGDIIGHEIVGVVEEVGSAVRSFRRGDRVVASSVIACGTCFFCETGQYSDCNHAGGIRQYGAQAEFVRIPYAEVGTFHIPEGMTDLQALACTDAFPTGYFGADLCRLKGGETVAVWGAGPVGLFAMKSAYMLGAAKVIAIDDMPERLELAAKACGAIPVHQLDGNLQERLNQLTKGHGPDCCIEAVGMDAQESYHLETQISPGFNATLPEARRAGALREIMRCCRKGGTIAVLSSFAPQMDRHPLGILMDKGIQMRSGQMHGREYIPRLFTHWQRGQVDPSFVFTHHMPLGSAQEAYEMSRTMKQDVVKIALRP